MREKILEILEDNNDEIIYYNGDNLLFFKFKYLSKSKNGEKKAVLKIILLSSIPFWFKISAISLHALTMEEYGEQDKYVAGTQGKELFVPKGIIGDKVSTQLHYSSAPHAKASKTPVIFLSTQKLNSLNQVLVQPMLENVDICGVAFTADPGTRGHYYVINYDETGSTSSVTSPDTVCYNFSV